MLSPEHLWTEMNLLTKGRQGLRNRASSTHGCHLKSQSCHSKKSETSLRRLDLIFLETQRASVSSTGMRLLRDHSGKIQPCQAHEGTLESPGPCLRGDPVPAGAQTHAG